MIHRTSVFFHGYKEKINAAYLYLLSIWLSVGKINILPFEKKDRKIDIFIQNHRMKKNRVFFFHLIKLYLRKSAQFKKKKFVFHESVVILIKL